MTTAPVIPETHLDLLQHQTGILSTIGSDGLPQVTALWFLVDDDGVIRTSLIRERQKYKNIAARPLATLFVIIGGCHADFFRNDFGRAAAGRWRLCL